MIVQYPAVSEHSLRANEMHAIGMITHIVEEGEYILFCFIVFYLIMYDYAEQFLCIWYIVYVLYRIFDKWYVVYNILHL